MRSVIFRAAFRLQPRLMSRPASQPPGHPADGSQGEERAGPPPDRLRADPEALAKKIRHEKLIEAPRRRRQNAGDDVGPNRPVPEQREPGSLDRLFLDRGLTLFDVGAFWRGEPRVLFRRLIDEPPRCDPDEAGRTREIKRPLPPEVRIEPRHPNWTDNRANVGAGIEEARGERTLLCGVPLRHGLDGAGKIAALRQPQGNPGEHEAHRGHGHREREPHHPLPGPREPRVGQRELCLDPDVAAQPVGRRRTAPAKHEDRQATLHAPAIHQAAAKEITKGVGERKRRGDPTVVGVGPVEFAAQIRLEDGEDEPVDVVYRD